MTESNRESAKRSRLDLLVLAGGEAAGDLLDAQLFELHGVDRAGDDEVVAQRDTVPVLLGGPPVDPEAPRAVHGEVHRDLAVIGRQVVLGQQVGQHRHLGDLGELRLLGVPVLAAERVIVLAVRPRDVVVRVPVLTHGQVSVDVLLDHWLELCEQLQVGQVFRHEPLPSYLYLLVALNISVYPGDIQVATAACHIRNTSPTGIGRESRHRPRSVSTRHPAQQHLNAVVDELLARSREPAVQGRR